MLIAPLLSPASHFCTGVVTNTMREPSDVQRGAAYTPGSIVRRTGAPPEAGTFHTLPPTESDQATYVTHRPSGENMGSYSRSSFVVSRRGFPPCVAIHTFPSAPNVSSR